MSKKLEHDFLNTCQWIDVLMIIPIKSSQRTVKSLSVYIHVVIFLKKLYQFNFFPKEKIHPGHPFSTSTENDLFHCGPETFLSIPLL